MRSVDRVADQVLKERLSHFDSDLESKKPKDPSYAEQRCVTVDPNAYRARRMCERIRSPRSSRRRRPEGWSDYRFVLPKVLVEGVRCMAIRFAFYQAHHPWGREGILYPKTLNFYIADALNRYLKDLGYTQFCIKERELDGRRRVRRLIAPQY